MAGIELSRSQKLAIGSGPAELVEFRRCIAADVPWLIVLATRVYPPGRFDPQMARAWLEANIKGNPNALVIRSQNAALICISAHDFLAPQRKYSFVPVMIGQDHIWEMIRLCRVAKAWAKTRGATRFMIASDDDVPDVEPIAKRLGLKRALGMYEGEIA